MENKKEYRYFKNENDGSIIKVPVSEIERYAYLDGILRMDDDGGFDISGDGEIFDLENKMVAELGFYDSTWWKYEHDKMKDEQTGEIFPVDDLEEEAIGFTYWDGSNYQVVILKSDRYGSEWEEVEDLPKDGFGKVIEWDSQGDPGFEYGIMKNSAGKYFYCIESHWQGSLPYDLHYEIDKETANAVSSGEMTIKEASPV